MTNHSLAAGLLLALIVCPGAPSFAAEGDPDPLAKCDRWAEWSREFAAELRAVGRLSEAVDELHAIAVLDPRETESLVAGAMLLIDVARLKEETFARGTSALANAEGLAGEARRRGCAADARLAYVEGRIAWADHEFYTAHDKFTEVLTAAEAGDFDLELARTWRFRSVVNRAPGLILANRLDEAIDELTAEIEKNPDHHDMMAAKINLADAYRRRNERTTAETILIELTTHELYGNSPRPWFTLGQLLRDEGRLEDALEKLERSIALSSAHGQSYDTAQFEVVDVLMKLGRTEDAEMRLDNLLERRQDSERAFMTKGLLARERGELGEAVRLLRRAHRMSPKKIDILSHLKSVHYQRGNEDEAEEIANKIDELQKAAEAEMKARMGQQPGAPPEDGSQPAEETGEPTEETGEPEKDSAPAAD